MDKGMIIRTIVLILALVNQILVMTGISPLPFTSEEIEYFVTGAFTVVATLWTWYKNNSITKEAKQADTYLKQLKRNRK
ncbi:hypothetical protein J8TS2_35740 [Lederbergia ruris]|uniref:Phage holin n=1 Tax=Lederbergia ruris TaxID=217495 RepID=A0ABQ4KMU9_9BACI|nr:phage holin [Lederbergia ruris]GIN59255.1 hypothetical protein J8TS2_35740 [Lederbergia ruris]